MDAPFVANRCGAKIYGSISAKNVALGGDVPEDRIVVFQDGSEFSVGEYKVRILKSLHSKPIRFNNDLGVPIEKPLTQPASLRAYKEGGSFDFLVEHGGKSILICPSFNYIKGQLDGLQADVYNKYIDDNKDKEDFREDDGFYKYTSGIGELCCLWKIGDKVPFMMSFEKSVDGDKADEIVKCMEFDY